MNKRSEGYSRRDFLNRMAVAGAVTVGSSVLAACGGGGDSSGGSDAGEDDAADPVVDASLNCNDPASLTEVETVQREALQYVELSEVPDQDCTNCNQNEPPSGGSGCGTCKIVPGPINPAGHCSVWVALADA